MSNYVVDFIRSATTCKELATPDKTLLNGFGERPEVWDSMESLAMAHKQGGPAGAKVAWETVISKAIPDIAAKVNKPKRLFHGSELESLPPTRWLVDNQIPEDGIVVIFGPPGIGKSFVAMDYSERIGQRKPGVYIMGEGESGYKARHKAWLKHNKLDDKFLYFYDGAVLITNTAERSEFMDDIRDLKPKFIVIDTFARCFDGEENSAKDVGAFIRDCDAMRRELHCTIILVHHTTKNSTGERGSSALRGAADTMIEVSDNEGILKLSCSKMKNSVEFPPMFFKKVEIGLEPGLTSCVLIPSDKMLVKSDEFTPNQLVILQWLSSNVFDQGARSTDLRNATGLSTGSFFSALNNLSRRGFIRKEMKYDPWILTKAGIEIANRLGITREMKTAA